MYPKHLVQLTALVYGLLAIVALPPSLPGLCAEPPQAHSVVRAQAGLVTGFCNPSPNTTTMSLAQKTISFKAL